MECQERHPGCHGKCDRYAKESEEWEKWKANVEEAKAHEHEYIAMKRVNVTRSKKFAKRKG